MDLALTKKFCLLIPNLNFQHQTHVGPTTTRKETRVLKERKYSRSKCTSFLSCWVNIQRIEMRRYLEHNKESEIFSTKVGC